MKLFHVPASLTLLALSIFFHDAHAQQPSRPTTLVVPYAPGGATDLLARLVASNLASHTGQSVLVENRAGAGGYVGSEYVARSAPDGLTLLFNTGATMHSQLFVKGQSTVLSQALVPIAGIGEAPFAIVAPTSLPAKNLREFVSYVKANPGRLNAAVITGGVQILDTVTFLKRSGLDMAMIPYNDGQGPLLSLLRGENHLFIGTLTVSRPHIESGKVVALAVAGNGRFSLAPDIPTAKEQGVNFESTFYYAVFGPGKLPRDMVTQLNKRILASMDSGATRESVRKLGFDPVSATAEEMSARFLKEDEDLASAAVSAGIKPQ